MVLFSRGQRLRPSVSQHRGIELPARVIKQTPAALLNSSSERSWCPLGGAGIVPTSQGAVKSWDMRLDATQKSRKVSLLPVSQDLAELLRRWAEFMGLTDDDEWMFRTKPSFSSRLSFELRQACAKHGIQAVDTQGRSLTAHGICHGRISHWAVSDVPVHTLQRLARHAKIATTARYLCVTDDLLRLTIEDIV